MFDDQMFDVYGGRKVDIAIIEAGQDSQGELRVSVPNNQLIATIDYLFD
jgi:hypothetical protein